MAETIACYVKRRRDEIERLLVEDQQKHFLLNTEEGRLRIQLKLLVEIIRNSGGDDG